jgi:hypothetical protein
MFIRHRGRCRTVPDVGTAPIREHHQMPMRRRHEPRGARVWRRRDLTPTLTTVASAKNTTGITPEESAACQGSDHSAADTALSGPMLRTTFADSTAARGAKGRADAPAVGNSRSGS